MSDQRAKTHARALWYVAPRAAELRETPLEGPRPGEVLVRTLFSGLSRGTERLVFEGRIPASEYKRMRAPGQEGDFPFPVKYGYAAVGMVEDGPEDLMGRKVFALYPHQDRFVLPAGVVVPIPDKVPPQRAVLTANMETALNALWDGRAAPSDRILVIGGGLVGLLAAALAARLPGTDVTLVDKEPARASLAEKLGIAFAQPAAAPREADLVIHTSATETGLALALEVAGEEATVVEASWYGEGKIGVPLGGAFHSRRLRLISSQVGGVPPHLRARWTPLRRKEAALRLLADDRFDALLGEEIPFAELPHHLPRLLAPDAAGVGAYVRY